MIEADGITFGYRRGRAIVERWTASIGAGEIVSVVGPSGSGKSTLLYLLGTLVRPWSGTLKIAGVNTERLGDGGRSDLRSATIGFVFQDALLDPRRSVIENVIEGAIYRGSNRGVTLNRARALLELMGVDVESRRKATDLSGGQAQRVALCRALLHQPTVILADEPTGNLDQSNAAAVEAVLFDRARSGAAVVVVTHDEALAARCDRVYRL